MSYDVEIVCDGVGCDSTIVVPFSQDDAEMELHAEAQGWCSDESQSETHYCPACTDHLKEDKQ